MDLTTTKRRFSTSLAPHAAAAAFALLAAVTAPAQFQYTYGLPNVAETGITVTRLSSGYLLGAEQLNSPFGVITTWAGNQTVGKRHPSQFANPVITPHCVRPTADGGIIVSGEVTGNGGDNHAFLAHYSANGTLWANSCLGPGAYHLFKADPTGVRQGTRVVEMAGGGYASIANIIPGAFSSGVLFTTGADGCGQCWKSYSSPYGSVRFHDLCQDTDGSLLIVGSIEEPVIPGRRTLLLRTDCDAAPIWAFSFATPGFGEDVEQHAITLTNNGKCAVWGHFSATSNTPGSFLYEFDANGSVVWHTRFATIAGTRPTISRGPSGDLWVNGRVDDDALVMRTNSLGVAQFARTYGTNTSTDEIFQVLALPWGGFVAAGTTDRFDSSGDTWLLNGNSVGDLGPNCPSTPYATPQTWPQVYHDQRQLLIAGNGISTVALDMDPFVDVMAETPICYSPMPVIAHSGSGSSTSSGYIPDLSGCGGYPVRGNSTFYIEGKNLIPGGLSMFGVSTAMTFFPLMLIGGMPGATLYLDPSALQLFTALNDGAGRASMPMPIPANPALIGATLHWQVFDFDPMLGVPLPFGTSRAMSVTIQ